MQRAARIRRAPQREIEASMRICVAGEANRYRRGEEISEFGPSAGHECRAVEANMALHGEASLILHLIGDSVRLYVEQVPIHGEQIMSYGGKWPSSAIRNKQP